MGTTPPSDPVSPVNGIQRFTTEYDLPEDRIRLSVEMNDGQIQLLWLTRRLCVRLVPQVAKVLGKLPQLQGPARGAPTDNAQRRSQLDALGRLENQDPVRGEADAEVHLITQLSMRIAKQAVILDFKAGEDDLILSLPFPEPALRQWIVMLNVAFRRGQWGDDVWPDWISVKGGEDDPDPVRLN